MKQFNRLWYYKDYDGLLKIIVNGIGRMGPKFEELITKHSSDIRLWDYADDNLNSFARLNDELMKFSGKLNKNQQPWKYPEEFYNRVIEKLQKNYWEELDPERLLFAFYATQNLPKCSRKNAEAEVNHL